ncbi:MAG TPA: hypothetical protein VHD39_03025, partial [Acidimicrobiales bacterium]|nr:hypothetical protein [Acidimicrobiales bacterium]
MTQLATPPRSAPSDLAPDLAPPDQADRGLIRLASGEGTRRARRTSIGLRLVIPVGVVVAWW